MEDKFKISFNAVIVGIIVIAILAMLNITIYSRLAGVGLFSTFSRAVGIILLLAAVVLNLTMLTNLEEMLERFVLR